MERMRNLKRHVSPIEAKAYAARHANKWFKCELSQEACSALGFLSGDRDRIYYYNTTVERVFGLDQV